MLIVDYIFGKGLFIYIILKNEYDLLLKYIVIIIEILLDLIKIIK